MFLVFEDDTYTRDVLESHAITEEAFRALAADDPARFLSLRRRRLIELERGFAESIGLNYTME